MLGIDAGNKHLNRNRWRQVSPTVYNNAMQASPENQKRLILFKHPLTIAPPRTVMEQLPQIQKFEFTTEKKSKDC